MAGTRTPAHEPATELLPELGARVRRARTERGMTVRELAEGAGLSSRFIAQVEGGEANIAVTRLAAVAAALGLTLTDLVAGADRTAGTARSEIDRLLAGRPADEVAKAARAVSLALGAGTGRPRAIALIGLRGAGKSTIGAAAAKALGMRFVELDDRIEEAAGLSLREVFAVHGEAYYRRLESEALMAVLADTEPAVIALPGGVVLNQELFDLVRRATTCVWLKARPEDHMTRVMGQGDQRPMAGRPNAMAELRAILASREPYYRQAAVQIDTSKGTEAQTRRAVLMALKRAGW